MIRIKNYYFFILDASKARFHFFDDDKIYFILNIRLRNPINKAYPIIPSNKVFSKSFVIATKIKINIEHIKNHVERILSNIASSLWIFLNSSDSKRILLKFSSSAFNESILFLYEEFNFEIPLSRKFFKYVDIIFNTILTTITDIKNLNLTIFLKFHPFYIPYFIIFNKFYVDFCKSLAKVY